MDRNSSARWFENILPQLEENYVIVLDKAPYHIRKLEKNPMAATGKNGTQDWIRSKMIPFYKILLKVELLVIVYIHKKTISEVFSPLVAT